MQKWLGIDYGSKLSGTTALAWLQDGYMYTAISEKGNDAGLWLHEWIDYLKPDAIFLDAPLSLPGLYSNPRDYTDYFYRKCDRELRAMSPMFIGGLTARAMKFAAQMRRENIRVYESYPGGLAKKLLSEDLQYKKQKAQIPAVLEELGKHLPETILPEEQDFQNWHQVDALLAWMVGYRINQGIANHFGDEYEGLIWV